MNDLFGLQLCGQEGVVIERSDGGLIPLEMLSPENEIRFYEEVYLYEDELADRGTTKSYVRVRAMNDCWFVLLRSYVILDKVAVRILDTRVFHKFDTNEIIRDFMWKEETWEKLLESGADLSSEWLLSPHQSDIIYDSLQLKMQKSETIKF